jgi:hypothetical protein
VTVARVQYEDAARIQSEIFERNPQKVASAYVADEALVAATADTATTATSAGDATNLGGQPASYYGPAQWPTYTTGTVPAAGSSWHRKPITVKDPGGAEQVWVCVQTSSGGYEWLIVGQASS